MAETFDWSLPPLDSSDQRLIEAYLETGRPLDDLAYTEDFERLFRSLGPEETDEARHRVFKRLLRLRSMGRLPRLGLRAE